ncbi:MAG: T9SS type A sorting domain-containing protein [Bacteroidia bacterium]|nr:T9SS type A sorting domain-containing protein [Bacteroidia bacterium]
MIDLDGSVSYSSTIEIRVNPEFSFSCYPNPVQNLLTIQSTIPGELIVLDVTGRQFFQQNIQGTETIQTQDWAKGVYFLQFRPQNGSQETIRLIKE